MKQYYLKETTPLKYHKFLRWVGLPLSCLISLGQLLSMLLFTEYLNWGSFLDLAFYLAQMVLVVTAMVGFSGWKPSGWYAVVAIQWLGIAYALVLLVLNIVFVPGGIASALGSLIGVGIVSALVLTYYRKRRPLFFPAMVPAELVPIQCEPEEKPCPLCGHMISQTDAACSQCGYTRQK